MHGEIQICLVSLPLIIKTPILLDEGPILVISFNVNCFPKGHISKCSHNGVRAPVYEFGGGRKIQFSP